MLVYYFVPFIVSNRYLLFWVSNGHNSVTVQNRTHFYMNFFDHKDLGNHLLQLCPEVVKHPVYYKVIHGPYNVKLIFEDLLKIRGNIQASLKSDKNNGYFTWRPMYMYGNISLISF